MVKCKDGPYVDFEQHQEIVAALAAENKRLRKAGDDLAVAWARVRTDYHTWNTSVKAWDAAKEGRHAK